MEAKLERKAVNFYKNTFNNSATHEETMEMIVPDALPDIQRVVDTDGVIILRSKEAEIGKANVGGVINATVLYMPEGESEVIRLELKMPFTSVYESGMIDNSTRLTATVSLCSIDCRVLNPRKVLVRADVLTQISGYGPMRLELCSPVEDDSSGIEYLVRLNSLKTISDVREKTFVVADEYSLPASRPMAGDILKTKVKLTADDMKTVGSKLIIKGTAEVSVIYGSKGEGELTSADFSSPYSQIVEMESAEDPDFAVTIMPTGTFFDLNDGPNGSTLITMELHAVAQIVVMENKIIEYISDAYSNMHDLMCTAEDYSIDTVQKGVPIRESIKATAETPVLAKNVVSVSAFTGRTSKNDDDMGCRFETPLNVSIIYKSEDGRILSASQRAMVITPWEDACENVAYVTGASCGDVLASAEPGGIEVRVNADFRVTTIRPQPIRTLSNISYDESKTKDLSTAPSVTLKRVIPSDSLWELAKRYNSTQALIAEANGLDGELETGRLVLIPKRR